MMGPFQVSVLFLALFGIKCQQQFQTNAPGNDELLFRPMRPWRQSRFIKCIFCMNYDDYNNLSTYGCDLRRVATCVGNYCYMRQHKKPEYFLYTSGCLNLTVSDLGTVRAQILPQKDVPMPNDGGIGYGNETQLCEVGTFVNTCICTDRPLCNNVTSAEPFLEYANAIFSDVNFDELAHLRHLLPNDPLTGESGASSSAAGYILIANSVPYTTVPPSYQTLTNCFVLLIIIINTINYYTTIT